MSIRRGLLLAFSFLVLANPANPARAMSIDEARHLLTRSGFGASPSEIQALLPLTREQAVDRMLAEIDTTPVAPPPSFVRLPATDYLTRLGNYAPPRMTGLAGDQPELSARESDRIIWLGMAEMAQLRVWWLDQMISTHSPLTERIALFWHNHFTSQYFDVLEPKLMFDQLQTIRAVGTQNFATLLTAMMHDPAMLIYLDNALNTRDAINENFGRETLELFTLGIGNYAQEDVRALARILAGNSVDFAHGWGYVARPGDQDTGVKTFLGHSGRLTAEDATRILLDDPQTARFIAGKFYREFVSPDTDAQAVERLASVLRDGHYAMRPFLRALFLDADFWDAAHRGQLVKSPVDLLVGFMRSFGVSLPDGEVIETYSTDLGQQLFEPPSVQGWKGGLTWLTPQTVNLRALMMQRLWAARDEGRAYLAAAPDDLVLRYSAEISGDGTDPAAFTVLVDGRPVYRGQARHPADKKAEGPNRIKPMWEVAAIDRRRLPAHVRTITIAFDKPQSNNVALFVNWVQLDGKRYNAAQSHVSYRPDEKSCNAAVPIGMLYCTARMRFDIAALRRASAGDPPLADRHNAINSIIEYGTARQKLAMRPAALDPRMLSASADTALAPLVAGADGEPPYAAILPIAPMRQGTPTSTASWIEQLSTDPAYNLK